MAKTTMFFKRLDAINQTRIWKHWSGYLVAPQYQYSLTSEYYAIRNSVSLLDTSPLFKYQFSGNEATKLLQRVLARDIGECSVGQAQYTVWCNDAGFVLQDGVIMRTDENEYLLTAAEPTLRYFQQMATQFELTDVSICDVSEDYGILALQGPHAFNVLSRLVDGLESLGFFDVCTGTISTAKVIVSRTGFTGDLGYEIWIPKDAAESVWDELVAVGDNYNLTPIGTTALKMARVEAGLLLMGVDFDSARYAWVDAQRETPLELGWGWMFKGLTDDPREFIGRKAIEVSLKNRSSRWKTVGLEIDWHDFERVHLEQGILPLKHDVYQETTMSIYRRGSKEWDYAGYATTFLYSSLLKKPLAIAKLPLDLCKSGTEVDLEVSVIRKPVNVLAKVAKLPFFNPPRKTEKMGEVK